MISNRGETKLLFASIISKLVLKQILDLMQTMHHYCDRCNLLFFLRYIVRFFAKIVRSFQL